VKKPDFYKMLVSQWQTIVVSIEQTWHEYKATLLASREIALMSTIDYHMTHYAWMAEP
jgi:hypothetical protein